MSESTVLPWENLSRERRLNYKRAGMVINQANCVGCHACGVACKTEHEVQLGGFRIRTHYLDHPERPVHSFLPMMCMHCQDAPCIKSCPNDAIVRRTDGRVEIEKNDCEMDTRCVGACPYGAIHIDRQQRKADKCNFCVQRTDVGLQPACVDACPTQTLVFGDLDNPDDPAAKLAASQKAAPMKPEAETRPSVVYIGLQPWMTAQAQTVQLHEEENQVIYEQGAAPPAHVQAKPGKGREKKPTPKQ
jgi:tetrathionate reductase subunit B